MIHLLRNNIVLCIYQQDYTQPIFRLSQYMNNREFLKIVPDFRSHCWLSPAALVGSCGWCGKMRFAHFSTPPTRSLVRRSRTNARSESIREKTASLVFTPRRTL